VLGEKLRSAKVKDVRKTLLRNSKAKQKKESYHDKQAVTSNKANTSIMPVVLLTTTQRSEPITVSGKQKTWGLPIPAAPEKG